MKLRLYLLACGLSLVPAAGRAQTCVAGFAGPYPCSGVNLSAHVPLDRIGGGIVPGINANDIWGWTDPMTGKEYALVGRSNGTAFVDVSVPEQPIYVGNLPPHGANSTWRDIKVYGDHALVVSEAAGHGMQVFDLTQLRNVESPPVTFAETAHYANFGDAHNIAVNEATGYAYAVGTGTCGGGLHMLSVQDPLNPGFAGCAGASTHDTQCVLYAGPDVDHAGKEICFNSAGATDTLDIVDVTNKAAPVVLASTGYAGAGFAHQGWLSEDHNYFLLGDELDESIFGHNTRTYIWDVSDLDLPVVIGTYTATTPAIDHNQYVRGGYLYQANYRAGLRILSLADVAAGNLSEVAVFDVHPANDAVGFNGAWSVYPYFASGTVVVSSIEEGLFVLRPRDCSLSDPACVFVDGFESGDVSAWSTVVP